MILLFLKLTSSSNLLIENSNSKLTDFMKK